MQCDAETDSVASRLSHVAEVHCIPGEGGPPIGRDFNDPNSSGRSGPVSLAEIRSHLIETDRPTEAQVYYGDGPTDTRDHCNVASY